MTVGNSFQTLFTTRRIVGLLLLALLALFNTWLLFSYRLPGNTEFWLTLHESGHGLIFLLLSLSLCVLFHLFIFENSNRLLLATVFICIAFGGAVELVQSKVGRSASWSDFWLDLLGVCAGVSLYLSWLLRGAWRWVFLCLAVLLIGVDLYDPYKVLKAGRLRAVAFPVIADFDNPALNFFVHAGNTGKVSFVAAPDEWPENATQVAKLEQFPGAWPGLNITEVFPDWRNYQVLEFDIFNPQPESARFTLRVHDAHHDYQYSDRYNKTLKITQGLHHFEIPLEKIKQGPKHRANDMANIRGLMIYSYKLDKKRTLYVDNIQLR